MRTARQMLLEVIAGKDKGKQKKFYVLTKYVVVGRLNIAKKHAKPSQAGQGGIEFPAPIHVSNVKPVDPNQGSNTCGLSLEDGKKVRSRRNSNKPSNQ